MKRLASWLLVLLFIGVIFYCSGQPSAQQDISPYIAKYSQLIKLLQDLPAVEFNYAHHLQSSHQDTIGFIQFVIRKITHMTIYGLLGLAIIYALETNKSRRTFGFTRDQLASLLIKHDRYAQPKNQYPYFKSYQKSHRPFDWRSWILAGIFILTVAMLDEYHQSEIASRTGCVEDVIVDLCGYLLFTALFYIYFHLRDLFY